jgi:hypothetical protein
MRSQDPVEYGEVENAERSEDQIGRQGIINLTDLPSQSWAVERIQGVEDSDKV